jgi:hypothetical protein
MQRRFQLQYQETANGRSHEPDESSPHTNI